MSALFNRPYTEADTVLVRIENNFLLVLATICNYISVICCVVAILIAGFDRSSFDGAVQTPIIGLILSLFYTFIKSSKQGDHYQDQRVYSLFKKYCLHDGRLKSEYISIAKQ